jgi:hypothetical protein
MLTVTQPWGEPALFIGLTSARLESIVQRCERSVLIPKPAASLVRQQENVMRPASHFGTFLESIEFS